MIDFQKIDIVMERTGAEYKEVKEALLRTDSDVDQAISYIENKRLRLSQEAKEEKVFEEKTTKERKETGSKASRSFSEASSQMGAFANDIIDTIKEIWEKGNASSLVIEKNGETVLRLSLTVGTIGLVIAPVAAIIGLGAALITEYTIKIYMDNGKVINVNEVALLRKSTKKTKMKEADPNIIDEESGSSEQ